MCSVSGQHREIPYFSLTKSLLCGKRVLTQGKVFLNGDPHVIKLAQYKCVRESGVTPHVQQQVHLSSRCV